MTSAPSKAAIVGCGQRGLKYALYALHTDALDALKSHELVFKIEESRLKGEVVHFYR